MLSLYMDLIYDSARVAISFKAGNTGSAVLSFAGVGLGLDGLPHEEFVRTLEGYRHDQFFIIDKLRSWYNATADEILEQLSPRLERHDAVYTLGNSMGGFGAIYFGRRLPRCRAVVAFGPQYSVHPDIVPGETRWRHWRRGIKDWSIHHALVGEGPSVLPSFVFYGRIGRDRAHARLFLANRPPGLAMFLMQGTGHHTASFLKQHGCLATVLDAIFSGNTNALAVAQILKEHGIRALRRGP